MKFMLWEIHYPNLLTSVGLIFCITQYAVFTSFYNSYRNNEQDATVYQNLLFHVYMKLNMIQATHRPSSGAQNCTSSLWFCLCERLMDVEVAGRCPATSMSNSLSRMQNQRLLVQFWAPDDGRCVARNMLSFI